MARAFSQPLSIAGAIGYSVLAATCLGLDWELRDPEFKSCLCLSHTL